MVIGDKIRHSESQNFEVRQAHPHTEFFEVPPWVSFAADEGIRLNFCLQFLAIFSLFWGFITQNFPSFLPTSCYLYPWMVTCFHCTQPDSSWPATWVLFNAVPFGLPQVRVPFRVLWGYSTATGYTEASATVVSEYPYSTLKGTLACSSHSVAGWRNLDVYFWWMGRTNSHLLP